MLNRVDIGLGRANTSAWHESARLTAMNPGLEPLRDALQRACKAQNVSVISDGRAEILAMPRAAVLSNIESAAAESLTLSEEWEYRRLLEVYAQLDSDLLRRLIAQGLNSSNPEVREAAEDFQRRLGRRPR